MVNKITKSKTLDYKFGDKHIEYMQRAKDSTYSIAEGAVRAGKTVDNVLIFALKLETSKDKYHLASGATVGNAKLNIGACNGLGLENIFRGRSRWGKHLDNEALFVRTATGEKVIIFSGGGKADSFKTIRGNSYGYWIATEIDQHHKSFIQEALARQLMARDMALFWDLNPNNPNHFIYTEYIDEWGGKEMAGGFNFEHFTIYDNESLTSERKQEIASRYKEGTVEHSRNILGLRMIAEGLVYDDFANAYQDYFMPYEQAKDLGYNYLSLGVDIGGSASDHAFVLTGITRTNDLIALSSRKLAPDIDPEQLALAYVNYARELQKDFDIQITYFESASQVLKRGFESASRKKQLTIPIRNSIKLTINDRISATQVLIAQSRFYYTENAKDVVEALKGARWDPKQALKGNDVRLDDGSSDIDTLDAFEYSFSKHIAKLMKV